MNRRLHRIAAAVLGLGLVAGLTIAVDAQATNKQPAEQASKLDLNTASASQLETLPGIGPKVAARILEYREKNGAFKKVEDLMNVQGIGEKSFLRLKDLIVVGPPKGTEKAGARGATP